MPEVWRILPEFRSYEITEDGDVRNRDTKIKLSETLNTVTGAYSYNLRRRDGRTTQRHFWGLVYSAFPELLEGWESVVGFTGYQINKEGVVRGTRWYNTIPEYSPGVIRLRKDKKRIYVRVANLLDETFKEEKEAA